MKVYCKDCKHYFDPGGDMECLGEYETEETWLYQVKIYAKPYVKNKDNDCPDWSPNLRYRLARWLKI